MLETVVTVFSFVLSCLVQITHILRLNKILIIQETKARSSERGSWTDFRDSVNPESIPRS